MFFNQETAEYSHELVDLFNPYISSVYKNTNIQINMVTPKIIASKYSI